jgi:hypothetical protein
MDEIICCASCAWWNRFTGDTSNKQWGDCDLACSFEQNVPFEVYGHDATLETRENFSCIMWSTNRTIKRIAELPEVHKSGRNDGSTKGTSTQVAG